MLNFLLSLSINSGELGQWFFYVLCLLLFTFKLIDVRATWFNLEYVKTKEELKFLSERNIGMLNLLIISLPLTLAAYLYFFENNYRMPTFGLGVLGAGILFFLVFEVFIYLLISLKYQKLIKKK